MKILSNKIQDIHQGVLLYELLPPSHDIEGSSLEAYIQCAIELLDDCPIKIDAVNIPDIRKDPNDPNNHNKQNYTSKLNPGLFAHQHI